VLDRRQAQAYRCAVYLLRRVVNEPIAKGARRAGISAPRVSQIQAEAESTRPQGLALQGPRVPGAGRSELTRCAWFSTLKTGNT
jgi:hypothetical protein